MLALGSPLDRQLKSLNKWMKRPDMGNVFLRGLDYGTWDPEHENFAGEDLFALVLPSPDYTYTNKFSLALIHYYNRILGRYIHVCAKHLIFELPSRKTDAALY